MRDHLEILLDLVIECPDEVFKYDDFIIAVTRVRVAQSTVVHNAV